MVFSGFSDDRPRYNYINTLRKINANKLFILDELGRTDYPGAYYLGEHGDYSYKENVITFIKKIANQISNECYYFTVGSSKGGWCSLYFGMRLSATAIFAGAPQYLLGNYLDCDFHQKTFQIMIGDNKMADKALLNSLLPDVIEKALQSISALFRSRAYVL